MGEKGPFGVLAHARVGGGCQVWTPEVSVRLGLCTEGARDEAGREMKSLRGKHGVGTRGSHSQCLMGGSQDPGFLPRGKSWNDTKVLSCPGGA